MKIRNLALSLVLILALVLWVNYNPKSILKITQANGEVDYVEFNRGYDIMYDHISAYYDTDSTSCASIVWIKAGYTLEEYSIR